jgi:hypothetical protein
MLSHLNPPLSNLKMETERGLLRGTDTPPAAEMSGTGTVTDSVCFVLPHLHSLA